MNEMNFRYCTPSCVLLREFRPDEDSEFLRVRFDREVVGCLRVAGKRFRLTGTDTILSLSDLPQGKSVLRYEENGHGCDLLECEKRGSELRCPASDLATHRKFADALEEECRALSELRLCLERLSEELDSSRIRFPALAAEKKTE